MGTRAALAATLGSWLRARADEAKAASTDAASASKSKADSDLAQACIVLWMNGGPSHLDTWDPKPGSSAAGPAKAVETRIKGVQISANLPRLAERADKLCIIRGMTSREGNHDRARHLVHTGYSPTPTVMHPSLGAWVSEELGDRESELPCFVSINGPSSSAGFLGVQFDPFVVRNANKPPQNVEAPKYVDPDRYTRREQALGLLEEHFAEETGDTKVVGRREVYGKALRMMRTPRLKAFDLSDEPDSVKAQYGDSEFGRGCLMARRLIESGVRFVEVALDGWDTHQDNFDRTAKLGGALDPGFSGLLDDLAARHLLDRTLILCLGEFGRTPKINERDGRDHHPAAWSAVLAGGGIRGGVVHGQTDDTGDKVVAQSVAVPDFMATCAVRLGLDPDKGMVTPLGRPIAITDNGKPLRELLVRG
jgi:hypothetical protein